MQANRCRRPNLGDLMILVVAGAIALVMTSQPLAVAKARRIDRTSIHSQIPHWRYRPADISYEFDAWSLPWLVPMTFAALAIRLRGPRPPLRRLCRQPGFVAEAMGASLLTAFAVFFGYMVVMGRQLGASSELPRDAFWTMNQMANLASPFVAGGWLALLLTRRLRREPGWIDGLGVLVGTGWTLRYLLKLFD